MGYWDAYQQGASATRQLMQGPLQDEALQQENDARGLAVQNSRMDSQEKSRLLSVGAGMRQAAAGAQATPAVTTTTENGGYSPAPPVDTTSSARALLGAPAEGTPAKTRANEATFGVVSPTTEPTSTPAELPFTPVAAFNPVADQQAAQAEQDAKPTVTTTTAPGAPANHLKAQIEYLNSIGEPGKAQALSDTLIDHANKVMALTGNPNDALKIINDATGEKLAYSPLASLDAITNDGQLVGYIDKNKYKELVTAGAQPMEAMKGAMIPLDMGGGGKEVLTFLANNPNATDDQVAAAGAKAGVPLSKMIPLLNERQKVQAAKAADERQQRSFEHSEAQQARQIAASDARQERTLAAVTARQENKAAGAGGLSEQAVNDAAEMYNINGTLPSGRNKEANAAIQNRAAELRKSTGQSAAGVVANAADLKAVNASILQQEKQVGAMGSFVKNIDKQVNRFEEISKELKTADARLLNVPIRALRGRVAGSPLQSKIDMYLTEISSETGKLASGATGSVAELSQGAREKWEKIHDPNLSMADLLSLLKETKHAGTMRMDSVNEQLADTRKRRDGFGKGAPQPSIAPAGMKVAKKGGGFYTSDGKGGWN